MVNGWFDSAHQNFLKDLTSNLKDFWYINGILFGNHVMVDLFLF